MKFFQNLFEHNTRLSRILCMTMYQNEEIDNKIAQLRKGILELAILAALYRNAHYGYSLVRTMTESGALEVKEGTIYPILSRLAKEGLVQTEWMESKQGPPRKYYSLTPSGRSTCKALDSEFRRLVNLVDTAGQQSASDSTEKEKPIILRKDDD
jgi:PadR family transcriptional regulator, regulatory protein PadR